MSSKLVEPVVDAHFVQEIVDGLNVVRDEGQWNPSGARFVLGSDSALARAFWGLRTIGLLINGPQGKPRDIQEHSSADAPDVQLRTAILNQLASLLEDCNPGRALPGWLKGIAQANQDEAIEHAISQAKRTWELMRAFVDEMRNPIDDNMTPSPVAPTARETVEDLIDPDTLRQRLEKLPWAPTERWALYDALVPHQAATKRELNSPYKAELPVVFVQDVWSPTKGMKKEGRVGLLTITRRSDGAVLYPELGVMGLTTLSVDETEGFSDSVQRVWDGSSLAADDAHRYAWSIVRHPQAKPDSLALPRLHDRSCEAAFLCTLWAASGGIPGDDDDKRMGVDSLDIRSTVTAKLGPAPFIRQVARHPAARSLRFARESASRSRRRDRHDHHRGEP